MFSQTKTDDNESKEKTKSLFENKGSTGAPSLFNDNPQEEEELFKKQPLGLKKEISTYPGASGE